jgi:hypothetical protein
MLATLSPRSPLPAGATVALFAASRRSPSGWSASFAFAARPAACAFARSWAAQGVRPSLRRLGASGWSVSLPVPCPFI